MKYYIALAGNNLRTLFTDEDLEYFAEQGDTRSPFEMFSGVIQEEIITDIFVCELTNQGLIYTKRLNQNLEEEDL